MKSPARLGGKLALQDRSTAPTVVHKLSSSKAPQLQISPALQLYNSLYTALQLCTAPLQEHYSATALVQLYSSTVLLVQLLFSSSTVAPALQLQESGDPQPTAPQELQIFSSSSAGPQEVYNPALQLQQ